jgi:asparagine synthase (glutamine-hydrolysing)
LFEDYLYDNLVSYSLPALLRYEDRNSMAHSVEARVPFLDYRLAEFIVGLPLEQKIRSATTKVILRQAMRGILPEEVRQRRDKMGFITPEKVWLKAELGALLREVVHSPSFVQRGYLDARQIQHLLAEHQTDQRDISFIASRWLSLELWFRQFVDGASPSAMWRK